MYTTIICQKKEKRKCILIAQNDEGELELEFRIPFFKTKKNIWILIHEIQRKFNKKGFNVTGSQVSSALTAEYANIPYMYY